LVEMVRGLIGFFTLLIFARATAGCSHPSHPGNIASTPETYN